MIFIYGNSPPPVASPLPRRCAHLPAVASTRSHAAHHRDDHVPRSWAAGRDSSSQPQDGYGARGTCTVVSHARPPRDRRAGRSSGSRPSWSRLLRRRSWPAACAKTTICARMGARGCTCVRDAVPLAHAPPRRVRRACGPGSRRDDRACGRGPGEDQSSRQDPDSMNQGPPPLYRALVMLERAPLKVSTRFHCAIIAHCAADQGPYRRPRRPPSFARRRSSALRGRSRSSTEACSARPQRTAAPAAPPRRPAGPLPPAAQLPDPPRCIQATRSVASASCASSEEAALPRFTWSPPRPTRSTR